MLIKIILGLYNERVCLCCMEDLSQCVSLKISIAYQSITAVFELWKHARVDLVPCTTFLILHNNCILLQLGYRGQKQTLTHNMHARCQVWIGLEKNLRIVYLYISAFSLKKRLILKIALYTICKNVFLYHCVWPCLCFSSVTPGQGKSQRQG